MADFSQYQKQPLQRSALISESIYSKAYRNASTYLDVEITAKTKTRSINIRITINGEWRRIRIETDNKVLKCPFVIIVSIVQFERCRRPLFVLFLYNQAIVTKIYEPHQIAYPLPATIAPMKYGVSILFRNQNIFSRCCN